MIWPENCLDITHSQCTQQAKYEVMFNERVQMIVRTADHMAGYLSCIGIIKMI